MHRRRRSRAEFGLVILISIKHSEGKQWRPNQTDLSDVASDLGLHCFLKSHKKDARLTWVKSAHAGNDLYAITCNN